MIYVKSPVVGTGATIEDARRPLVADILKAIAPKVAWSAHIEDGATDCIVAIDVDAAKVAAIIGDARFKALLDQDVAAALRKLAPAADASWLRASNE
jgi:hypothetical protein